ncbi:MAG: hypothetical protein SV186_01500 [Candidatus Nanohaloarchaea archaeon]|nr:hypothetical protein [Candidatus Nanohaloarchaea archaeon]
MSLGDASYEDLQQTTISDLYETYREAEAAGNGLEAASEIERYLQDGFETVRETLRDYGIELEDTPDIRYNPDHQGATYSPQRDHTGPLDVGRPVEDPVKEHTLLNALVEEAVHTYHNQVAGDYFDELELGEKIGPVYNDNCVVRVGYDEALAAPIVHDVAETDEPLDDHMERLAQHYQEAGQQVGENFVETASFILQRLDEDPDPASIEDGLGFRDEMLQSGDAPF